MSRRSLLHGALCAIVGLASLLCMCAGQMVTVVPPSLAPTPVPLASPIVTIAQGQNPKFQNGTNAATCTTAGNGSTDDAACIQSAATAAGAGSLQVKPGTYLINAAGASGISLPAGLDVRCCTDPKGDCSDNNTADYRAVSGSVAFLYNSITTNFIGLRFHNATGGSIQFCQFRGPNYNSVPASSCAPFDIDAIAIDTSLGSIGGGQLISGNDFNGPVGYQGGGVQITGDGTQQGPTNVTVCYNTFEHCELKGLEIAVGSNNDVAENHFSDCSLSPEAYVTAQANFTGNFYDSNFLDFPNGTGFCQNEAALGVGAPTTRNYGTAGSVCHVAGQQGVAAGPCDMSGNTFSNNKFSGKVVIQMQEGNFANAACANASGVVPANYVNNTCTGLCTPICP